MWPSCSSVVAMDGEDDEGDGSVVPGPEWFGIVIHRVASSLFKMARNLNSSPSFFWLLEYYSTGTTKARRVSIKQQQLLVL